MCVCRAMRHWLHVRGRLHAGSVRESTQLWIQAACPHHSLSQDAPTTWIGSCSDLPLYLDTVAGAQLSTMSSFAFSMCPVFASADFRPFIESCTLKPAEKLRSSRFAPTSTSPLYLQPPTPYHHAVWSFCTPCWEDSIETVVLGMIATILADVLCCQCGKLVQSEGFRANLCRIHCTNP